MGVRIYCDDVTFATSYTYFNELRKYLYDVALEHADGSGREPLREALRLMYSDGELDEASCTTHYFDIFIVLRDFDLVGLLWFLSSSDCDGSWSPQQARDMCNALDVLSRYMEREEYSDFSELYNVFERAVTNNKKVIIE